MKQLKLLFTVLFLAVLGLGNVWATTYKLTQATSVAAGKKYVFIQDTHAFGSTVSSSALQTVTGYNTTGLAGTEAYVWTLETATGGFYMKNVSLSSSQYLNNSSSTGMSFGNKNSIWTFDFTDVNAVLIQNKSNSSRFLGYTTATSYVYKAYATTNLSNYPHAIKVYVLEEETSGAPTCSTPTITFAEESVAKLTTDAAFTNVATVEFNSVATGQAVSWSVEDGKAGVATVNATTGEVTIKGAGTAKIYASVEANATYCEKSAYYTLTVTEPPFEGTIVTMKAANDADIKFVTGSSAAASAVWANSTPLSAKGITLSGGVTSGTNYTYYDGSVVRFYANNNLVITPVAGITIKKVEIVRQSTASNNSGVINCSGLTAADGNTTTNTNVYTGSATSAVTFTAAAQARFTAINVYYTGTPTEVYLSSIEVKTAPTKVEYTEGDFFDPAGLVITKIMSDETTEDVEYAGNESDFTFSPALDAALKTTDAKVTITYAGKPVDQAITVAAAPEVGVSFENELTTYTDWTFSGITSKSTTLTAKTGAYHGVTSAGTAYAVTKTKVNPASLSFYVSKCSGNTTASTWKIQVSSDGTSWTDIKSQSATSMSQGTWVEVSANASDFAAYTNVFVRIYYGSSTAVRAIDDIVLTTRELAHSTVSFAQPAHGTVSASATENVEEGTQVTLTYAPADGYKLTAFDAYKTGDEATKVTVSADGKFTMPAFDVTATATIEVAKVLDGTVLTLGGEYPTEFWKGDAFSHDGLTASALFNTGAADVTSSVTFSTPDMTTVGTKTITVTYTEGGASQTATYDITVKTIANTKETAYTVAEAKALIDAGKDLATEVYVKGTIDEIVTAWSDQYNNITYGISGFQLFRCVTNGYTVGDDVIAKGILYKHTDGTYEFKAGNTIVAAEKLATLSIGDISVTMGGTITPVITTNIVGEYLIEYVSSDNEIVLAMDDEMVTDTKTGTATITATVVADGYKTVETTFSVTVNPAGCVNLVNIVKGAEENGTFTLSVSGEQCADDEPIVTTLTATPAEHYTLSAVTSLGEGEVVVGTVGEIAENSCTISGINANTTITAVFVEDAKGTATFVAGAAEATGTAPAAITKYVGEKLTVPANTFVLAGHTFAGWKVAETTYQKGDEYTVEGDVEFVAQWNELPVWAHTYTSNVTVGTDAVKFSAEGTEYEAKKAGTKDVAGSTTVKVPAGATALHFHAAGWNETKVTTLKVSIGETVLASFALLADAGMNNNSPYTLQNNPEQTEYFMVALENITEETTITFAASDVTTGKRFAIYGVNYVAPASVTLDPTTKNFGDVKEGETAEFEFTATKNIFATGDIVVTFEGADAAAFSASTVDAETGKFIVTFAPNEIRDYSATVKVSVDGAEATATLAGTGISATTPAISTDVETIDFGSVKQDAAVAGQTVNVTLEYLDAANVAISGTVFTIDKTGLTESGAITISANTAAMGTYTETLTISGEGATSKTVTVTMNVVSKYASEYTSNVSYSGNENAIVKISEESYDAVKSGTGTNAGLTTITLPAGVTKLHFHAAGWKNETTKLTAYLGSVADENKIGDANAFALYADNGVTASSPFTLAGNNYDAEQYFMIDLSGYTIAENDKVVLKATTGTRYVVYGVNQEGGILPVLDHIAIEGTATELEYTAGATFDPAGLTVKAYYTMEGVIDDSKTKTLAAADFEWSFSPATLAVENTSVEVTATYEGKTDSKTINGLTVNAPTPTITVDPAALAFGTVNINTTVEAKAVAVTLENLAAATVAISGEGAAKFAVDVTNLTESGNVTVSATTDEAGEFNATLTIAGEGAESKTVALSMTVVDPSSITEEEAAINVGYTNAQAVQTYVGATLTITYDKGDGTEPKYYTTGNAIRIYKGNTVTITATKNIYMVEVAYSGEDYTNLSETTVANNNHGYVVCDGTNIVTLTNTSETQSRITDIKVYYEDQKEEVRGGLSLGKFGTICVEKMTLAPAGAHFYTLNQYDAANNVLTVSENTTGRLEAGVPYIFEAEGANIDGIVVANDETAKDNNGLYAVLGSDYVADGTEYGIVGNEVRPAKAGAIFKAGRCYIKLDEVSTTGSGSAPARAFRVVNGTNTTTGMESLELIEGATKMLHNSQVVILRDGKCFDVTGRLVK